jgi:tetratricopeptide (TPR) repeat protein
MPTAKKYLLAIFCWMLSATATFGTAREQVDSLLQLIPLRTDTAKAKLFNDISWAYYTINTDSLFHYAEKGLILSNELNYHGGRATSNSLIGIHAEVIGDIPKSLEYQLKALEIRQKHSSKHNIARSLNSVGIVYDYMGKSDKAFEYYNKSLELKLEINDRDGLIGSYSNIGLLLNDLGSYNEALENFFMALNIVKELNREAELGLMYNNIGLIFDSQKNYDKAIEYYRMSIEFDEKHEDIISLSYTYSNIGEALANKGKWDEALTFHQKALDFRLQLNDQRGLGFSYHILGAHYYKKPDLAKALEYYQKCLSIREKLDDQAGVTNALADIGRVYDAKGDLKSAQIHLERGLEFEKTEDPSLVPLNEVYRTLSTVYAKQGKFQKAYTYKVKHMKAKDSLFTSEKANNIAQLEMQFKIKSQHEADSLKLVEREKRDDIIQRKKDAAKQAELDRQKIFAYGGIALAVLMMGLAFVLFRGYRRKQKDNEVIIAQKSEVEEQREIVTEKNKEITDSIAYAKRLQDAILPSEKSIKENLGESFILFKPKDIVSGDFYWMEVTNKNVLFAAVDCTGHGVPGAMVSVVGHNGLNRCVKEFGLGEPAAILDKLSELVEETFDNADTSDEVKDGMDMAICGLTAERQLQYAGAHNPIYIVRQKGAKGLRANDVQLIPSKENEQHILYEVKGDKQPIGVFENRHAFANQQIALNAGDTIYIFSDGYADQFGGPKGKKFKYSEFKNLLLEIQEKPMEEQQQILDTTIEKWRGDVEQVDDICIIGVRV